MESLLNVLTCHVIFYAGFGSFSHVGYSFTPPIEGGGANFFENLYLSLFYLFIYFILKLFCICGILQNLNVCK